MREEIFIRRKKTTRISVSVLKKISFVVWGKECYWHLPEWSGDWEEKRITERWQNNINAVIEFPNSLSRCYFAFKSKMTASTQRTQDAGIYRKNSIQFNKTNVRCLDIKLVTSTTTNGKKTEGKTLLDKIEDYHQRESVPLKYIFSNWYELDQKSFSNS